MVFESLVVDVLNRFLGDYVVNLDSSQLKLGIWGGDAILRNLEIKENALSQLDIPFKIPWKNLYTQSVEATLDGVYLLIVPTASIKYDAEKEEKQLQEARQRELHRIEETKQKAAEQGHQPQLPPFIRSTADENWNPCLLDEKAKLFFKLVQLDSLFAYWNVNSLLFSHRSSDDALGLAVRQYCCQTCPKWLLDEI
ncbi:hypothetical protein CRUP_015739 [Coryphaenoides rupestris]|nr:hypothetical protein CRUP_015739 [Coryphaenoides rupestris]